MRLTVLYDANCPICIRCRDWMVGEPAFVELDFLPCRSREAEERFGQVPWLGEELVVVSEAGEVWAGPAAFLICLWALREWREWSYRLSGPTLAPLAERFFHAVSTRRKRLATWLGWQACKNGQCRVAAHPYRQPMSISNHGSKF
jgi:predicted DCC family thiol-disulfide oxidoreductase YuxK